MSEDDILVPLYDDDYESEQAEREYSYSNPASRTNSPDYGYREQNSFKPGKYRQEKVQPAFNTNKKIYKRSDETVYYANHRTVVKSDKKPVNQMLYALFAIFLGSFGIHKFYSGKIFLGLLYLLLSWTFLPATIGFIEGLVALGRKTDSDGNILV